MRILFVNSARDWGGGHTTALELATGLTAAGHEVTLVCQPGSALLSRIREHPEARVAPLTISGVLNLWRIVQLRRLMRAVAPDVVLADRHKDVKFAVPARGLDRTPAIVHRHGAPHTLPDRLHYRLLWPRLDALIVNSEAMKQAQLRRTPWLSGVPVHVIHNGKDIDRFRPRPELRAGMRASLGIREDEYVAGFHGSPQPRKHVDDLLHAAARLDGRLALHLLVVGYGMDSEKLEAMARRLGIRCTFTGIRTDVPEVLSACDVSVNLSSAEGFSNSVIEALACGLPVIASRAHSHPEQIEDGVTGRLVPMGNIDAVVAALIEFADPAIRRRAGEEARRRAESSLDFAGMIEAYVRVFRAAVAATRSRNG
jgi:glycosyltransferase involved in cell wall biosynthesis